MKRTKYPVRYLTIARAKELGINLSAFPNAGPNPNVTGMRMKYWGWDALLVRQGRYVYNVGNRRDIYFSAH